MIALGFTENTMILDECSTSHQTILLDEVLEMMVRQIIITSIAMAINFKQL